MTTEELKRYINNNDKIPFVLEKCGCHHIKDHGKYVSAANPDGNNIGAINIYKNDWLNYVNYTRNVSADMKQDIISLVQYTKKMNFVDAFKWLHNILGLQYTSSKKSTPAPENKKEEIINIFKQYKESRKLCDIRDIKFIDPKELRDFEPLIFIDWYREGVMPWSAKKFNLMYSYEWHRIIIPHRYWLTNELIGYNARTTIKDYQLLDIPKFYISPGMRKQDNLYGLAENLKDIEQCRTIILGESEKSVIKQDSIGRSNWVALSGKSISSEQVRIILSLNIDEIIVSLDNDVSEEQIWAICNKFYGLRQVSYTKDKWHLLGEKDCIADVCKKKCDFLLEHRVKFDERLHNKYISLGEKR